MINIVIDEITRLSQEEGLTDVEIADKLGLSRVTICRVRKQYEIPRSDRSNRKDKVYTCIREDCNQTIVIARKERKQRYCPECKATVELEKKLKRREYTRKRMQEQAGL